MNTIQLRTEVPGPVSRQWLERRRQALPTGLARSTDVVIAWAEGAHVRDVDGNDLLDFAGGIGMLNAGHRPPAVVEALKKQLDQYLHVCTLVATIPPYVELAELLNSLAPGNFPKKTLLANSGSEAVENAVNIARYYTRRPAVVCFEGAYHGRTLLTLSLTSKYGLFKKGFGPFCPDIYRLEAPYPYRRPACMDQEEYIDYCCRRLEEQLVAQVDPAAVAAIIIEPVQGEGGFIPMPTRFLQRLRELATAHGIVLIFDEIQCGAGRTGKFFACEHSGVIPDMICMAKSIGSGLPISAVVGKAEIMDSPHPGGVGGTYGGSPLACVAALETIRQIASPTFLQRAQQIGAHLQQTLSTWKNRYRIIGDVRGLGAMQLIEFVRDGDPLKPDPEITLSIIRDAVAHGLLLIRAGLYSSCIRLLPPLVISDDQLHEGLAVLEAAIARAEKQHDK
ncbi:MAG: aspartate aminotransferase family protein [Chitinophagales bacterium]|nr:aspartate aminotransferase family protein [Chitinophagales bacterium]MDW8428632.1 aspartate aminotransferase family protein [Chitinophagales bacterium]